MRKIAKATRTAITAMISKSIRIPVAIMTAIPAGCCMTRMLAPSGHHVMRMPSSFIPESAAAVRSGAGCSVVACAET
jgi:hypothetical protein